MEFPLPPQFFSLNCAAARRKRAFFFAVNDTIQVPDDEGDIGPVTEFVDIAMLTMDIRHGTDFYKWIRNEKNVCAICLHLAPLISEYEKEPPHIITRAMMWLTESWSTTSVAELLIKLFFHWGIGNPRFAELVRHVVEDRPVAAFTAELVATLLVGERPRHGASLVRCLTQSWPVSDVIETVALVCERLKWTPRYFRKFIFHFVNLDNNHKRMTYDIVRNKFELRNQATAFSNDSGGKSDIQFCISIFEMCVIEAQELRYRSCAQAAREEMEQTALEKTAAEPTFGSSANQSGNPRLPTCASTMALPSASGSLFALDDPLLTHHCPGCATGTLPRLPRPPAAPRPNRPSPRLRLRPPPLRVHGFSVQDCEFAHSESPTPSTAATLFQLPISSPSADESTNSAKSCSTP